MAESSALSDPALTLGLALAAGMLAQTLARHLRVPGIVLLLGAGVLLGPDVLSLIHPEALGKTLHLLVGFSVAVILFEGGMNLDLRRLRRQARSIRQLVTVGAAVTAVGGTLAARLILGWDWPRAALFGCLVIVTGPTVITPLLRRIRLKRKLATVLEAEGVLIDAIGAVVAVVALEVALAPSGASLAVASRDLVVLLGFGSLLGIVSGLIIGWLLRLEHLVPEGLENVFTLSLVLALFQISNALLHESGIVTVTMAGLALGNADTRSLKDLKEFKEQLTILLIGMLFVLLAADVRIDEVRALGWRGVFVVAALMLIVRPLNILAGTWGSDLSGREKTFLAWLAPRGIVAAAISSLFAERLKAAGSEGGNELRALIFLVIAATVLIQGLSGGLVAGWLGVRRASNTGFVVAGANRVALSLAGLLQESGEEVVLIESNPELCNRAEEAGFRVLFGNALAESLLTRAELDSRAGAIGLTPNSEVNLLFARRAREEFKVAAAWVALRGGETTVNESIVARAGVRVLFGEPYKIDLWALRLERQLAVLEAWQRVNSEATRPDPPPRRSAGAPVLPLALRRGKSVRPFEAELPHKHQDELHVLIFEERRVEAETLLLSRGWQRSA